MTSKTDQSRTNMKAIWTPGWYELDQTIIVGERKKFWFFEVAPLDCVSVAEEVDLVFFNQLASAANFHVRYATIREIFHPKLGILTRVDAEGLDYIFTTANGDEILVNAEENPGTAFDEEVQVDDWSVFVELTDVSEPESQIA